MKITSTIFMAVCLPVFLFSQISFEKDYSFDGIYHVYGKSVMQSSDGGFISTGITFDAGYGPSIFMFKADEQGDSLWFETNWIYVQEEVPYKMLEQIGIGYLAGPSYYNPFMNNIKCYLVQTNDLGTRNWDDWYSGVYDYSYPVDFIINGEGRTIILNKSISMDGNDQIVMLHEIDETGSQLNTYAFPSDEELSPVCLIERSEGGYLLAGFIGESSVMYLQQIDASFNETWMTTHDLPGQQINAYYLSLMEQGDGNFIASTSSLNPDNNLAEGMILNFDASGNLLETHHISRDHSIHFADAILADDGNIIACGKILEFESVSETLLLYKLSIDGEVIWERYFHGLGIAAGYALDQAVDGGFAITGMTRKGEEDLKRYYLLKTDAEGLVTEVVETPHQNPDIRISPNPASEKIQIDPGTYSRTYSIDMFNSSGSKLISIPEIANRQFIAVEALKPGIYILHIHNDEISVFEKLIVE